jgi:hypothetical protein
MNREEGTWVGMYVYRQTDRQTDRQTGTNIRVIVAKYLFETWL